jgi:hypothetical protein
VIFKVSFIPKVRLVLFKVSTETIYVKLLATAAFSVIPLVVFLEEVSATLQRSLGKKVILKTRVDETLVGGVVLRLPDGKIFDYSYLYVYYTTINAK